MNDKEFSNAIKELNINFSSDIEKRLELYYEFLTEYNKKTNLTSIIEKKQVYLKHFYDSICIIKTNKIKEDSFICDVGTGAGFPGIVIALFYPHAIIHLLESNEKKCKFLNELKNILNLGNVVVMNNRAEIYAKTNREKYDIVTSRAVASLDVLCELCIPLAKVDGYFMPLKSKVEEELKDSNKIIKDLNSIVVETIEYKLPIEDSKRTIVIIKKEAKSKKEYPREYSKILKAKKVLKKK